MRESPSTDEQILRIIHEVDARATWVEVVNRHGSSHETRCRWRARPRDVGLAEAKRLKASENENGRLKKLVAGLRHRQPAPQRRGWTKVVMARQQRHAVTYLRERQQGGSHTGVPAAADQPRELGLALAAGRTGCRNAPRDARGDRAASALGRGCAGAVRAW